MSDTEGQEVVDDVRLLRIEDVEKLVGLSKSTIYLLEKSGNFPRRRLTSKRAVAWHSGELRDWIESRPKTVIGGNAGADHG